MLAFTSCVALSLRAVRCVEERLFLPSAEKETVRLNEKSRTLLVKSFAHRDSSLCFYPPVRCTPNLRRLQMKL